VDLVRRSRYVGVALTSEVYSAQNNMPLGKKNNLWHALGVNKPINCPSCKTEMKLDESLAAPLIEAIVEKFSDMQDELDCERRTMTGLWAKREEQIKGVRNGGR
jgi:hypothetical protein